jgi:NAD(P)-dependent dehydrogenase (short-subunit alcohol dehydrogenase family)
VLTEAGTMKPNPIATKPGQSLEEVHEALMSSPPENWDTVLKTNVDSVYFTIAAFIPLLGAAAKQGQGRGSVVVTGSIAGLHWDIGFDHLSYQVSKA